jgi:flagellar biosynthesis protein FlhF
MRIKSYFSATVEAAVSKARQELGDDALLLNARPSPDDALHLGAYEVVFGIETPVVPPPAPPTARAERPAAPPPAPLPDPAIDDPDSLAGFLARQDISPALIQAIETSLDDDTVTEQQLIRALSRRLNVNSSLNGPIAFVGPPGSGKTTLLVKLAIRESADQAVTVVCADSQRIAAAEQLRTLCSIAGLTFEYAGEPETLAPIVDAHHAAGRLVLIDLPGFGPSELGPARAWQAALAKISSLTPVLTLTATARTADLRGMVGHYRMFKPQRLAFTHLDETGIWGGVYSAAGETGWPVGWLTTGQSIPEDVEDASVRRIVDGLMGLAGKARAAAAAG